MIEPPEAAKLHPFKCYTFADGERYDYVGGAADALGATMVACTVYSVKSSAGPSVSGGIAVYDDSDVMVAYVGAGEEYEPTVEPQEA